MWILYPITYFGSVLGMDFFIASMHSRNVYNKQNLSPMCLVLVHDYIPSNLIRFTHTEHLFIYLLALNTNYDVINAFFCPWSQ